MYIYGDASQHTKAKAVRQNGQYYLIGSHGSYNQDLLLTKLTNYAIEWSKSFDQGDKEEGVDLIVDGAGNHYVSGTGNNISSTLFLKLTANGSLVSSKKIGTFHDRIRHLIELEDGNLLFYGELEGAISGNNQLALYKTDKNLNPLWRKIISHYNTDDYKSNTELYARQILELSDGSLVFLASYTHIHNPQSDRSIRLVKLKSDGSLEWVKAYSNILADNPAAIVRDHDGGFMIVGTTNSYSESGSTDIQLLKVNSQGAVAWAKTYGGGQSETAFKIIPTSDNAFLLGAVTNSFGRSNNDLLFLKIEADGSLQWGKTFGGLREESLTNLFNEGDQTMISGFSNSFNDHSNYQTFLLTISDFNEISEACFEDITGDIQIRNIELSTSSHQYTTSSFNAPIETTLTVRSPDLQSREKCLSCYEDQQFEDEICQGETLSLDAYAEDALAYEWNNGSTSRQLSIDAPGQYSATIYTDFCRYQKTFTISVTGSSEISLGEDIVSCENEPVYLHAPQHLTDGSFYWSNGASSRTLAITSTGDYWLRYDSPCGIISDTVNVQFFSKPQLNLGSDLVLCGEEVMYISPTYSGGRLSWSDGSDSSQLKIDKPGKYWATVENACGQASDTIVVSLKEVISPAIPNVITPNQDSYNETFVIDSQLNGAALHIYNRWGNQVFYSPAYDNKWDGSGLLPGIYYVKIIEACSGKEYLQTLTILNGKNEK